MKVVIGKVGNIFKVTIKDGRGTDHEYLLKDAAITRQEIVGDVGLIEIEGTACALNEFGQEESLKRDLNKIPRKNLYRRRNRV